MYLLTLTAVKRWAGCIRSDFLLETPAGNDDIVETELKT